MMLMTLFFLAMAVVSNWVRNLQLYRVEKQLKHVIK